MGIRAIIAAIRAAVPTVPLPTRADVPISCPPGAHPGNPHTWITSHRRETRDAVLSLASLPRVDDSPCGLRCALALQIAYRRDVPDDERIVMIAEDCGRIADYLVRTTAVWGGADDLWQTDDPSVEEIEDPTGRPASTVVSIPLAIKYRE
jgi:hypothetical protein